MIQIASKPLWQNEKLISFFVFIWLLLGYHYVLHYFFPFPTGFMGHDYSLFLPMFIDNYFWFSKNGLSPPWFSPAFCGGQVNFADPQSMYYSLPQFLIFADIELVNAIYLSVLIFAAVGFYGMYLLMKKCFNLNMSASLICAAIFMYNDFYSYRMIVGHMTFQGFMLIPLISYCLLSQPNSKLHGAFNTILAGILLAYWFMSGMAIIIIPCLLAIVVIALSMCLLQRSSFLDFLKKSALAGCISLALAASKLISSITFIHTFPRTEYTLPGFSSFIDIIRVYYHSLFSNSINAAEFAYPLWKNTNLSMPPHEMAFGLTIIPLLLITIYIGFFTLRFSQQKIHNKPQLNLYAIFYSIVLMLILLTPIAIAYYTPSWNDFLKTLPIISSTATPQRWMLIYIFFIIIMMGISIHSMPTKMRRILCALSLLALPILTLLDPKTDTMIQVMPVKTLSTAFENAKLDKMNRKITLNASIIPDMLAGRNYYIINGYDILNCYNPSYGYFLEKASFKSIEAGEALMEVRPNVLNIRNPACILYPKENNCSLWDNFSTQELNKATAFLSYQPFEFARSTSQRVADLLSTTSLVAVLLFLTLFCLFNIKKAAKAAFR